MPQIELTPALGCMEVLFRTKDAIYMRLPRELQRDCDCDCDICKAKPERRKWDTLVVATKPPSRNDFSWTVHLPNERIMETMDYWRRKGELVDPKGRPPLAAFRQ